MTDTDKAVIAVAKERTAKDDAGIVTLSSGVRARIKRVSPSLLAEVTARIKDPSPPVIEHKGREIENPDHPDYKRALERAAQERGVAAMNAMAMFGVELMDGLPKDTTWISQLKILGFNIDENDPVVLEFYYKKHIALGNDDWQLITAASGISQEDISQAENNF